MREEPQRAECTGGNRSGRRPRRTHWQSGVQQRRTDRLAPKDLIREASNLVAVCERASLSADTMRLTSATYPDHRHNQGYSLARDPRHIHLRHVALIIVRMFHHRLAPLPLLTTLSILLLLSSCGGGSSP